MTNKIIATGVLILTVAATFGYGGSVFVPRLEMAYLDFHDALVGGDLFAGLALNWNSRFIAQPTVYTYQVSDEWNTYGGVAKFGIIPSGDFPVRFSFWVGGQYDRVDLSNSTNISPGLNAQVYDRFVPTYGVGLGVDSIPFVCRGCGYRFTGEIMVGDFISPYVERFSGLNTSAAPETLSTLVVGNAVLESPFGAVGVVRRLRTRGWFGDNMWRVYYQTPYCCGGLFRGKIGWESGYLGFAGFEAKIKRFAFIVGVKIPSEPSLWMWHTALEFHPVLNREPAVGGTDIQILAPKSRSGY